MIKTSQSLDFAIQTLSRQHHLAGGRLPLFVNALKESGCVEEKEEKEARSRKMLMTEH